jgi:glycosyltransferase involved in cell wall biosynthesis
MNNGNNPLVSVVMATFNEPKKFIEESMSSILNQTHQNLELLIADDSTNEDTIKVIDDYAAKDNRVIVIRKHERMGFVHALNEALYQARGEYIARMDADDIANCDRFEKQLSFFMHNQKTDVLGGAMNIINEKDEITSIRHYPSGGIRLLEWTILRNPIGHPTAMYKASIVKRGLIYDEDMSKGCEDIEFWLRLRRIGYQLNNLQDVLINYRICEDMMNKRKRDTKQNFKARRKNICFKYFIFDIASLIILGLRFVCPNKFISWYYSKENKQKY